ncbi:MAG: O-antigen ligase family protein [Bacteroidetes bacterium]|nr:O-antigen ligase family protein [Bacteroidota bacterium]
MDAFRRVHLFGLALALIALPWSELLLSLSQFILLGNWLWEGIVRRDLAGRFRRAFTTAESAVFLSFFGVHVLGLLWTGDLGWGLDLCRILLPVLLFGAVLSSVPRLTAGELRFLLLLGAWSVIGSTMACLAFRHQVAALGDYRALSMFISHIRLALMLCFTIAALVHYWPRRWELQLAHGLGIGWCLFFLDLLSSLVGLLVLPVLVLFALVRWARHRPALVRGLTAAVVLALGGAAAYYVRACIRDYHATEPIDLRHLDERSAGGERYYHDRVAPQRENGHYVWIYVADEELERGWSHLSTVPFTGKDAEGQPLRSTLVRYLASLGQRKDSLGLKALHPEDVRRIEHGVASVTEGRRNPLRARIDQVLYEVESARNTGDPSAHSVTMRLAFLRTGASIAREHWLFGVGTGDTQRAFDEAYEREHSPLLPRWRLRAHNEYLTLAISFGVFGALWCLFTWWWPAKRLEAFRHPLFLAWGLIFLISCLSEDTIETQMGATFFALYYTLFTFAAPPAQRAPAAAGSA